MADEFKIPGLSKSIQETNLLNKEIQQTVDLLLRVSKEGAKFSGSYRATDSIKSYKEYEAAVKGSVEKVSNAYGNLNSIQKANRDAIVAQEKASLNLIKAQKSQTLETAKLKIQQQNLTKATKQQALEELGLVSAYDKVVQRMNVAGKVVQNLNAKKSSGEKITQAEKIALIKATIEFNKYNNAVTKADASIKRFNRNVGNYPKQLNAAAGAARNLANALGLAGGAFLIVGAVKNAFNALRQFDKQLIAVQKTTNLNNDQIKLFKEEVIDLGLKLKGISIQGLLASSEVAGQLGIKGRDNILKFSKSIELLKLTAKGIGEETVANFAKFIEVSKDTSKNSDRLGSVITDLGNNFATTEKEIINSAIEIQKGLQIYDVAADSVLGLSAATTSLGVQDAAARTSIRKTFSVISQSIQTGDNLAETLKLTGLTEKELAKQFKEDATGTFIKFLKGLDNMTAAGGNTEMALKRMGLAGDRTAPTLLSLASKNDKVAEAVARANKEYLINQASLKEAALSAQSLDSQINDLSDSFDGLVLSIDNGDGAFSKFFKGAVGFIEGAVKGMILFNDSFDDTLRKISSGSGESSFNNELEFLASLSKKDAEEFALLQLDKTDELIEKEKETLDKLTKQLKKGAKNRRRGGGIKLGESIKASTRTLSILEGQLKAYDQILGINNDTIKKNTVELDKNTESTDKSGKSTKKLIDYKQKLSEQSIQEQIKNLSRIIENEENSNSQIAEALRQRMLLQIELEKSMSDFKIKTGKLTGDALLLQEKQLQSKLTDIIIKGQNDINKAKNKKQDEDTSLDPEDIELDTESTLIDALVEAGAGSFKELQDLYDTDLEAFLKLAQDKLDVTKQFSDAQIAAMDAVFGHFGEAYEVDTEKFTRLFDDKENTTQDYVDASAEAVKGIANLFQKSYDGDIEALRSKYETQLVFANGNADAEKALQDDLESREAEINRKKAKQDRDQAVFNILIDTARASIAALPNIPLSYIIGGIGAASAIKVASTPLPEFKDGVRDFSGGGAIVGDGGKSEIIRTPGGGLFKTPSTDTFVNLPKHSDVFSSEDAYMKDLKKTTDLNNIMFDPSLLAIQNLSPNINISSNGATALEMDSIMEKYFSRIAINQTTIDSNGFRKSVIKGNSTTNIRNSRASFKGFSV